MTTDMPAAAEALARRFHETYERLAPDFGYETRRDSAVPWEQVPEKNRALMTAVCAELLDVPLLADVNLWQRNEIAYRVTDPELDRRTPDYLRPGHFSSFVAGPPTDQP